MTPLPDPLPRGILDAVALFATGRRPSIPGDAESLTSLSRHVSPRMRIHIVCHEDSDAWALGKIAPRRCRELEAMGMDSRSAAAPEPDLGAASESVRAFGLWSDAPSAMGGDPDLFHADLETRASVMARLRQEIVRRDHDQIVGDLQSELFAKVEERDEIVRMLQQKIARHSSVVAEDPSRGEEAL